MHTHINIEEARELYKKATKAIKYISIYGNPVFVFETANKLIQINVFPNRKECFYQDRNEMCDDLFEQLFLQEDDAEFLIENNNTRKELF